MRQHTPVHRAAKSGGSPLRRAAAALAAAVLAAALAGCSGPASADARGDGSGSDASDLTEVSFALDWAPNTNHLGLYVAEELGYFAEAGIDVRILPYASTSALQLISAGEADLGIAGQAGIQMGRTAGLDLVSVYRVTQTDTGRLVALGDRDDISRPADLDGQTFGGFGAPLYTALAQAAIQGDGGAGEFDEVALGSGAYEAMSQGRIDFTLSVATWQDLQADIDGHPYRAWRYQDFGVPEQQSTGVATSEAFLDSDPETARAFIRALARGYAYAAEHPEEAAQILIDANPDTLGTAEELVHRSAALMAEDGYFVSQDRPIGAADPEAWDAFGQFLFEGGYLSDSEGKLPAQEPDWRAYYTDELL